MLKIGVLGVGHLGKIHLKCIQQVPSLELVGFFDLDDKNAAFAQQNFNIKRFSNLNEFFDSVEVVDIVTPTTTHFALAKQAIEKGKHVFIEKPITQTPDEAEELLKLMQKHGVKVQVGHVERFNPALLAMGDQLLKPMFIEAHRLATFNPRGTDVSVVLDLMIHDLDIILNLVKSPVKSISATGVAVVSETPDLSNARIEFENGCVANVTASRLSLKQMRKIRLFQEDAYISLDFLSKKAEVVRLYDEANRPQETKTVAINTSKGNRFLQIETPDIEPVNAIEMELTTFAESILNQTTPKVTLEDGYKALKLAHQITEAIEKRNQSVS